MSDPADTVDIARQRTTDGAVELLDLRGDGVGLHIHRSERTDALLTGLSQLLSRIPTDPFARELVAVPTPGIERFITQSLSTVLGVTPGLTDGVCANVEFASPSALVTRVIAQATGVRPEDDPWLPRRLVWQVLSTIDASLEQAWAAPLAVYLDGAGTDRRFALAGHVSDLFTSYASQRPQMLVQWIDGTDATAADLAWQPPLFRRVRERIGSPGPAERLDAACAALAADPASVDLPDRLSVFGVTRIPAGHLLVLRAIAVHRDVHLWLADASSALWTALTPGSDQQRRHDASAAQVTNPLLRSLGRDSRELALRLHQPAPQTDEYLPSALSANTLLGALQRQLRDDADPWDGPAYVIGPEDRSLQVHSCHGQARQAEVVREVVLGLLQDDPDLQPRDIIIMCPDLAAFAPLLSAAFADSTGVRVRIADRTPEQSNEVLATLAALLDLVTGRSPLSEVLDFAARTPVRRRFAFDDDAMERLETLTADAGIRWGLDDRQRQEYALPITQGTWRWGMDRLLLGVAMSEDGLALVNGVLAVDDVNSGDVAIVGRLAELVSRLERLRTVMGAPHPVREWSTILRDAIEDLTSVGWADEWQLSNALAAVGALISNAADSDVDLRLADVRWLLEGLLAGRPTRANFRSGDLTICGLAPMRSVPHKVICLIGLDDGAFPRSRAGDGDDALARVPLLGERDLRSEDRQVLLDAIMATQNNLVITYTGADERTNEPRPPCVPLADLLDTTDAMTRGEARARVCVTHPLQPFDVRNFTAGALGTPAPFSHDVTALAAAQRSTLPRVPRAPWRFDDLPQEPFAELTLRELTTFLSSPPAAFLRTRLGVSLREADDPAPEQLPVELNGLEKWQIGDRSLHLLSRREPVERIAAAERARGALPPGALGATILRDVGRDASRVAQRLAELRTCDPRQVSVAVDLPNGIRLVGAVGDVYDQAIIRATFSKAKARDDLRLWPELLALAAVGEGVSAQLIAKDRDLTLTAPAPDLALVVLAELVELYRTGMLAPLPLLPATSLSYAKRRASATSVSAAVRAANYGSWRGTYGDSALPEVIALWGPETDLAVLLAQKPTAAENWFDEKTRFGMLARRLWQPVLNAGGGR